MSKAKPAPSDLNAYADEHTVFGLAVCMMECHVGIQVNQRERIAAALVRVGQLIQANPGFPERFRAVQAVIKAQMSQPPTESTLTAPSPS